MSGPLKPRYRFFSPKMRFPKVCLVRCEKKIVGPFKPLQFPSTKTNYLTHGTIFCAITLPWTNHFSTFTVAEALQSGFYLCCGKIMVLKDHRTIRSLISTARLTNVWPIISLEIAGNARILRRETVPVIKVVTPPNG